MPPSVIVVDDDPLVCSFYHALFAHTAYQIVMFHYPPAQLTDLQQYHPDLIVMECWYRNYPYGWSFVRHLRHNPLTATIPILLCTTQPDLVVHYAQEIYSRSIAIMLKPFDITHFFATVAHLLGDTIPQYGFCTL